MCVKTRASRILLLSSLIQKPMTILNNEQGYGIKTEVNGTNPSKFDSGHFFSTHNKRQ